MERKTREHIAMQHGSKKHTGEKITVPDLAYAKTELDPFMGKRVEVHALEKDVDELVALMRRAVQEGQKEQYASSRDIALSKLDQIIVLRGAFSQRDPEWKQISRYWQVARGIINEVEQQQSKKAGGGTEARTGVHSAMAIRKEPERRVVNTGRPIEPWEEQFFSEFPEARRAREGGFSITKWKREPLPWEDTEKESEPSAVPVSQSGKSISASHESGKPRSTVESFVVSPEEGWEIKLVAPISRLQRLFLKWFELKGTSLGAYERHKYNDPWEEADKKYDRKVLELTGQMMMLYERLKAVRDALRGEDVSQTAHVVDLLKTQLGSMRTDGKTEEEIIASVQELISGIDAIIRSQGKKKPFRKPTASQKERALL